MKANYFLGNGKFEVREVPVPEPKPGEVLIRVAACGVCGTDVHIYHGDKGSAEVCPPVVLGHELAGIVEKTGEGVCYIRPGDHVTVDPNIYCGKCRFCRIGKKQMCGHLTAIGVNRDGGFAEYCTVPESQCFRLNKELPLKYGAMTEPLACCLHGMDRAGIRQGDTVCVIGGGAIGLLMIQLAKLSGASMVILSEPSEKRRDVGMRLGADYAIDPVHERLPERLEKILGTKGADVVIECVGSKAAAEQAIMAAGKGASLLLFGVPAAGSVCGLPLEDVFHKELRISGSMINPDTHGRAAALINSGKIRLEELITHSYPVEKLEEAVHMQMGMESIKVMVGSFSMK
ncbi:MAG: zinc-dependent alcohol dehydrogenase family protein [Eubacteriales bacterium]|nr:zinc-dependent alcohol dehydrogenase family protein [Eubacteriales bacterium]